MDMQDFNLKLQQAAALLDNTYAGKLKERFFVVTGESKDEELYLTVLVKSPDESFYYPIECRINHKSQELDLSEALDLCLDYINSYLSEYFREQEEVYLPIDWAPYFVDGIEIFLKAQLFNRKLENLADQWLEKNSETQA